MLNRRSFFQTVMALGMGMLLPTVRSTDSSAGSVTHANASITGLERSATITPSGSTLAPILVVNPQHPDLDSLIERRADLLNDLNCAEIVGQYVDFDEFLGWDGDPPSRWAYCPFCDQRTVCSLEVGKHFFVCYWCDATGSVVDFYVRIKELSHEEASSQLVALLTAGTLQGRRPKDELRRAYCRGHCSIPRLFRFTNG